MKTLRLPRFLANFLKRNPGSGSCPRTWSLPALKPALQPVPVKQTVSRPRSGFVL